MNTSYQGMAAPAGGGSGMGLRTLGVASARVTSSATRRPGRPRHAGMQASPPKERRELIELMDTARQLGVL